MRSFGEGHWTNPVHLINGDSPVFAENQPLAAGSPWLDVYGQPAADVLTWEKVPFSQ